MSAGAADNTISADFRIGADEPLIKTKFNLFNVSKRTTADFDRDMALLKELSAQTMRTDLWLGEANERTADAVSGTVDHLVYDYSQIDRQYKATAPLWYHALRGFFLQSLSFTSYHPAM